MVEVVSNPHSANLPPNTPPRTGMTPWPARRGFCELARNVPGGIYLTHIAFGLGPVDFVLMQDAIDVIEVRDRATLWPENPSTYL
jgi:hypothetical protein